MNHYRFLSIVLIIVLALSAAAPAMSNTSDPREALLLEIENVVQSEMPYLGDGSVASGELLSSIYELRNYRYAWTKPEKVDELLATIRATPTVGLRPVDYNLDAVEEAKQRLFSGGTVPAEQRAQIELLLTDALIRLGYHNLFGKVNPYALDGNWNFRRDLGGIDPAEALAKILDSDSPIEQLLSDRVRGWVYKGMKQALADHRRIVAAGGWPVIPDGPTLRPGAEDPRLSTIERRLVISGDLEERASAPARYDAYLEEGVRRFQERHTLVVDGIIGKGTLSVFNVSAQERVNQLEVNLERLRWVFDDVEDEFVIVNIAGFDTALVHNREIVWETNVQVGRPYHQSPVFRDEIKYVVFNPTWTVPYSIATKEMLPKIQREPDYFSKRDFDVKDRNGNLVDPASVDWQSLSRRNFPYTFVQRPGPNNALGRVKFIFPNEHSVYLHDTPSKHLFSQAERTFSHGCIRVENPLEFAEQLLGPDWDQARIQATLDKRETRTVFLPEPLPILILYLTSFVSPDGTVFFYNDVYSRDARIARALDEPFRFALPDS